MPSACKTNCTETRSLFRAGQSQKAASSLTGAPPESQRNIKHHCSSHQLAASMRQVPSPSSRAQATQSLQNLNLGFKKRACAGGQACRAGPEPLSCQSQQNSASMNEHQMPRPWRYFLPPIPDQAHRRPPHEAPASGTLEIWERFSRQPASTYDAIELQVSLMTYDLRPRIPPGASRKPGQDDSRRAKSTGALRIESALHHKTDPSHFQQT